MWIHVCCYSWNTQYARRMLQVSAWRWPCWLVHRKYTWYTSHFIWWRRIIIVDISTWIYAVCSQYVTNHCKEIHCDHYIRTIICMFACYSCCMKMTLIVELWHSSRFCRVFCNLSFYSCPNLSWIRRLDNLPSFSNCSCILVLNCELELVPTYLSWLNMLFYSC